MSGHRGPVPWSLQPESCADQGPDRGHWADSSLHTAGPNNLDRNIRLDLLGPTAVGSGPGRSKESDADQCGLKRVEGGGYGEPNRAGPGRSRCTVMGKPLGYRTASRLPIIKDALRVSDSAL